MRKKMIRSIKDRMRRIRERIRGGNRSMKEQTNLKMKRRRGVV
jgi:hypothetical protein